MSVPTIKRPADPSGGEFWKPADHSGRLHLFLAGGASVDEKEQEYVAATTIVVLDADDGVQEWTDARVYQTVLRRQLAGSTGDYVLGRLGQGTATPGKSAPWILTDPTDVDEKLARQYLSGDGGAVAEDKAPF